MPLLLWCGTWLRHHNGRCFHALTITYLLLPLLSVDSNHCIGVELRHSNGEVQQLQLR